MSEPKLISPLLDGYTLGAPVSEHNGIVCYPAIKENSEKKYIVKIISVPASQTQMDALVLAGAYKDAEGAMEYFKRVAQDIVSEAQLLKELSRLEGFLSYEGWQLEPITRHRLGYEVYLVGTYKRSFDKYVRRNPVTHLEAMNLAMDLCSALSICRQAGAVYVDLKPGNIFISENKEYRIGDLGFIRLEALNQTLPQKYISPYTPPELNDPMESVNLTVDTYAVGMILYQLYNEGKLPEPAQDDGSVASPVNADYELAEIILKAIHSQPEERWQDPGQMGQALVAYMQRNEVTDTPITPYTPIDPEAQNVQLPREEEPVPVNRTETEEPDTSVQEPAPEPEGDDNLPGESAETPAEAEPETEDTNTVQPDDGTSEESAVQEEETESETDIRQAVPQDSYSVTLSEDLARYFAKADDLIAHEVPIGVIIPEIPDAPDPFAFATEDSIEAADLNTPFDPVMDTGNVAVKEKKSKRFLSTERKKKVKRFLSGMLAVVLFAGLCFAGLWYYQNIYMQSVEEIRIEGEKDRLQVYVESDIRDELLTVSCADNYGNVMQSAVAGGMAEFSGLLPNTMYTVSLEIDGFHSLAGQTSEVFTTQTTTNITAFSAVTGPEDGSVVLNFTVDGDEPEEWNLICSTANEEDRRISVTGHTATVEDLSLGREYVFTLDAGEDLSLSGKTSLTFLASRLILAEDLTVTTTDGTDMTIRWNTPGDTVVESWNVRCYSENGYEHTSTVTETEVYLPNIDPSEAYTVEVTAAGMTQPARSSITANPVNITALKVDDSDADQLTVRWEFSGTKPEKGWLLMYSIDGNKDMSVIKCANASASISPKLPEAKYSFTLQAVDGVSVFNNVHSYECPAAPGYDANQLKEADITMHLLKTPAKDNWSYDNTGSDAFTDQFKAGDPISIVLYAQPEFYLPGTDIQVMYVIRDAYGNIIPDYCSVQKENWRSIWYTGSYHYAELDLPKAPDVPGKYHLHMYIDGASVAQAEFTVE